MGGIRMTNKIRLLISIVTLIAAVIPAATGCSGGGGSTVPSTEVVNDTGGSTDGSGVSSVSGITVESGNIVVVVEDGQITINGDNLQLAQQNEDGSWQLAENITISVTDNSGAVITGSIIIDEDTGVITFVPDTSLDVSETYTITVTVDGTDYQATVIVAVDDTETEESLFADVPDGVAGNYSIKDLIVNGQAIFGWVFGEDPQSFKIRLENIDEGAEVYFTAYGVYNIEGHQNEIYYQRWSSGDNEGEPVKDFVWSGFTISVNEEDVSLDGEVDYSFWSTYIELKVMKDGEDITASSTVTFIVENN